MCLKSDGDACLRREICREEACLRVVGRLIYSVYVDGAYYESCADGDTVLKKHVYDGNVAVVRYHRGVSQDVALYGKRFVYAFNVGHRAVDDKDRRGVRVREAFGGIARKGENS